jgi:NitT/TauT family transport system substrate-binding protein
MTTMMRRVPAFLVVMAVALLGAGCATGGGSVAAPGGGFVPALPKVGNLEKTTLNVAVLPAIDSAGFFVAMHDGLFAQEGLTIKYSPAFGDSVIGPQVKGQYDITGNNYVSYIEKQVSGEANLQIIAEGSVLEPGCEVIVAMPDSKVQSFKEIAGHVLGVNNDANVGYLLVASTAADTGIPLQAKGFSASAIDLPSQPVNFPAVPDLLDKHVSVAILSEPFITQMEAQHGAIPIADMDQGAAINFPVEGYAVTKAWARANPNTLKAFQIALEAGQRLADTSRGQVEQAFGSLPKADPAYVDPQTAALMSVNSYPLSIETTRLQRVADVMLQFGFLRSRFNVRQMLAPGTI